MKTLITRTILCLAVLLVSMGASYSTDNFVITAGDPQFVAQAGQAAEKYRKELAIAWFGKEFPPWYKPCRMTIHASPQLGAGGSTTFYFNDGEVYGWTSVIQGSRQRVLDSVLPHEITHMLMASYFKRPLPRWADEGAATSVEHITEKSRHERMMVQYLSTKPLRTIPFNRMFAMTEYPDDIMPLYAQGYTLSNFLILKKGRRRFVGFLIDGMWHMSWNEAVKKNYDYEGLGPLQQAWVQWIANGYK